MRSVQLPDIQGLLDHSDETCISFYLPTHRTGREIREDSLRLKNMIERAEQQLRDRGLRSHDIDQLLAPVRQLLVDGEFWRNQSDGLAMFLAPDFFQYYRVPLQLEESLKINSRFHVTPLLPLIQGDGRFYLIAVSLKRIRLFEGTKFSVRQMESDKLPRVLREALNLDVQWVEEQMDRRGHNAGPAEPLYSSHGKNDPEGRKKDEMRQLFHRISEALDEWLNGESAPLVFVGVDYLFPLFRDTCRYRNLVDRPVTGNPDQLRDDQLHHKAWELVQPVFGASQKEAIEQLGLRLSRQRATTDLQEILSAADQGAVDTLLVAPGFSAWGAFDEDSKVATVHQRRQEGMEDLVELAVLKTLEASGRVLVVEREQLPEQQPIAAILRYPVSTTARSSS